MNVLLNSPTGRELNSFFAVNAVTVWYGHCHKIAQERSKAYNLSYDLEIKRLGKSFMPVALAFKDTVLAIVQSGQYPGQVCVAPWSETGLLPVVDAAIETPYVRQQMGNELQAIEGQTPKKQFQAMVGLLYPNDPTPFPQLANTMADYGQHVWVELRELQGFLVGDGYGDISDGVISRLKEQNAEIQTPSDGKVITAADGDDFDCAVMEWLMVVVHPPLQSAIHWVFRNPPSRFVTATSYPSSDLN